MDLEDISLEGFRDVPDEEFVRSPAFKHVLDGVVEGYGEQVADVLAEKGEATDKEIAGELDVKVKFVRQALEDLYDEQAVSCRRTVDDETGWIDFLWRLEPLRMLERLAKEKQTLLRETKEELRRERESLYFACENGCVRVEFDRGMELGFKCPECDGTLRESDNGDVIQALRERAYELEQDLVQSRWIELTDRESQRVGEGSCG